MADEEKDHSEAQGPAGEKPSSDKKDTSRIELSDAETVDAEPESGSEPLSVRQIVKDSGDSDAAKKSQTSRIDLEQADAVADEDVNEAAKNTTVRVDLTGAMARMKDAETTPAGSDAEQAEDERSTTARIALDSEEDETAVPSPEPPRTVRLKRPSSAPRTVVMKKTKSEPDDATAEKGTTSRIQVPEGAIPQEPASTRKTIRIKRSGAPAAGGAAKTLTISRPTKSEGPTLSAKADAAREDLESGIADEPGALFGILTIAAVLVLCVLVYILVAQTFAPDLPFPGRVL